MKALILSDNTELDVFEILTGEWIYAMMHDSETTNTINKFDFWLRTEFISLSKQDILDMKLGESMTFQALRLRNKLQCNLLK